MIGIDLGTTTCCVAVVEGGVATVVPNRGYLTTPSLVGFTASGKRVVGHAAKRQAITNPEHTLIAMKRLLGRRWESDEVLHTAKTAACKLVHGDSGEVRVELRDRVYQLPELAAMLLQELKAAAEEHLKQPVTRAVITVPAYFNDHQRQATRDAGEIAGLEVLRIINEPTAAAIAYGAMRNVAKTIVVYDLGGGTFDISIVRVGPHGDFDVLGTGGDSFLGGEDFDRLIFDWLARSFFDETGIDLHSDRMAMQRLKDAAETAKRELSSAEATEISLPFIASAEKNPKHLTRTLTRDEFEDLARPLVNRTIALCQEALMVANVDVARIDDVLMVGGSSRIPLVEREVARFLRRKPCKGVNPDEAVAVGAALHGASVVTTGTPSIQLRDVTSYALGFRVPDNRWQIMIARNSQVPAEHTINVTTTRPGQTTIRFMVLQGINEAADQNELLGEFRISGFRPSEGHHEVDVAVTFALDDQGMVRVRARDVETGLEQSLEIAGSSGLTRKDLEELKLEAQSGVLSLDRL